MIYKLLGFTFAMIIAPIGSYFVTVDTIYRGWFCFNFCFFFTPSSLTAEGRTFLLSKHYLGNSTYAGATAAIVANVVLLGYIIVAFNEDDGDGEESKKGI